MSEDRTGGMERLMKIIHCADLHLDSKMDTSLSAVQASERREELFDTFCRMTDYADRCGVRLIIMAGDVFDTSGSVSVRLRKRMYSRMAASPKIDFLYLKGNHDIGVSFEEGPGNLKRFKDEWTYFNYGNITVAGCETDNKDIMNIYNGLKLVPERYNIAVLHGRIYQYGSIPESDCISLFGLRQKNIDYLALGHIHSFSTGRIDERGIWCYSGCLEGRGFDECGEKGFVIIDTDGDKPEYSFVAAAKRVFHEVKVHIDEQLSEEDIISITRDNLKGIPSKDMVKIIFEGEIDESEDIDTAYISRVISSEYYCLRAEDRTSAVAETDSCSDDISLKGEFIRMVNERNDLDDISRNRIITLGLKALAGREIEI